MNSTTLPPPDFPLPPAHALATAIECALGRIPPLWPLGHFVAVNPYLGFSGQPFISACADLHRTTGAAPLLAAAEYLRLHAAGEIEPADLAAVARPGQDASDLLAALHTEAERPPTFMPSLARHLDRRERRPHWEPFLLEETTKWCATFFDGNQTTWTSPWAGGGFWAGWRDAARHDRNPEVFGLRGFRATVAALPLDPEHAIAEAMARLAPPDEDPASFLHSTLAACPGWAGYLQYLAREHGLRGNRNPVLREFLAMRLALDSALLASQPDPSAARASWHQARATASATAPNFNLLAAWQEAYERGYQRRLAARLTSGTAPLAADRPIAQAVFCIDVRSEVLRRHLERAAPGIATLGFAGFFGFPLAHRPHDGGPAGARCPVLLVPSVHTADQAHLSSDRGLRGAWQAFQHSAASCFAFVETTGLAFAPLLARRPGPRTHPACHRPAPRLEDNAEKGGLGALAGLAAGALRNMGLTAGFARLVLLCGHGSRTANNPHSSSLECGACGGFSGEVNARIAAAALNDPDVRSQLRQQGIDVPEDTWFVAGLHDTMTDQVVLFDLNRAPSGHRAELASLQGALAQAGVDARKERAPALGLNPVHPDLLGMLETRAGDISEVRPEWGLANNAAIVIAPRARTAGLNLAGRVFLHEYRNEADPSGSVLELILSAPVVVASWINLQYHASRVAPLQLGAGNKLLHNVVGGLGVCEGNGGDLRAGLPIQSLHDGQRFMHEPRRLSVFVDAPAAKVEAVLRRIPQVQALFDHGWIHLFVLEGDQCRQRQSLTGWTPFRA
jgi:uncharacterized protein YbcC (UPF0753/DUF2309 family)